MPLNRRIVLEDYGPPDDPGYVAPGTPEPEPEPEPSFAEHLRKTQSEWSFGESVSKILHENEVFPDEEPAPDVAFTTEFNLKKDPLEAFRKYFEMSEYAAKTSLVCPSCGSTTGFNANFKTRNLHCLSCDSSITFDGFMKGKK